MKTNDLIHLPEVKGNLFNGPQPVDLGEVIDALQGNLLDFNEQTSNIQARADSEKRELTEEETTEVNRLFAEFQKTEAEIERRMKMKAQADTLTKTFGRKTEPQAADGQGAETQRRRMPAQPYSEDRGKWGWRSFGEFASSVRVASARNGSLDPRLIANAPTTYGSEGVGEDGGFAVPPDFRTAIMEKVLAEDSLLSRTDQLTTTSNSITFPADETTPWDSSGGIQAYWSDEAALISQSKPSLKEKQVRLHKLTSLVPVTDELLQDAGALDGYLRRKVPEKFDFKIQNAIVRGSGSGQPVGILNSACLISVAKDTSTSPIQAADTIRYKNIVAMWARMYAPCRSRAVWLINQDIEPQLYNMQFREGVTGPVPIYMPANNASGSPFGTLFGRPVLPIEAASTLGDQGDIILADLSQYLSVTKTGGIRADVSIHLYFDYDTAAYRFIIRIAGMPWWGSAITPANGSATRSCFVTLDERA